MMIKRIISFLLIVVMIFSFAACSNEDNAVYDDYSYGLDENGFYKDLDKYSVELPNIKEMKLQVDDLLKFGLTLNTSENAPKTVDEYLKNYTNDLLSALGMATKKEQIIHGDVVTAQIRFVVDGKELPEYATTNSYKANKDGDAIVASFIDKKYKDTYEVEYTFPADDKYYPSKKATVNIEIIDVLLEDAINKGVVEANAEELSKYVGETVTDAKSLMHALRPRLASVLVVGYIETYLNNIEMKVPKQLIDYEMYRMKARLQQIGYTYSKYLEDAVLTDKDVRDYCETIAKSNLVLMLYAQQSGLVIKDDEVKGYYGENFEYVHELQGMPYMKLDILRDTTLYYLSTLVVLMDGDKVVDTQGLFPDEDIPGVGDDNKTNDSQGTTEPTSPSEPTTESKDTTTPEENSNEQNENTSSETNSPNK